MVSDKNLLYFSNACAYTLYIHADTERHKNVLNVRVDCVVAEVILSQQWILQFNAPRCTCTTTCRAQRKRYNEIYSTAKLLVC